MSFADSFAVDKMTVYSSVTDDYGAPAYTRLGVVSCEYMQGGSIQRSPDGTEFVPASTFYPVNSSININRGDYVCLGSFDDLVPPSSAEEVMKVSRSGDDYFGRGDDVEVFTG